MSRLRPAGASYRRLLPALLLLLAGCAEPPLARAWERIDLWATRPQVAAGGDGAYAAILGFQGREEARDLARLTPRDLRLAPVLRSPRIQVLRQQPGSVLSWPLRLGRDPYLAFTLVPAEGPAAACAPSAAVELTAEGAAPRRVWAQPHHDPGSLPSEVVVALDGWQSRSVELRLVAAGGCPVQWGSPEVVSRKAVRVAARRNSAQRPNLLLIGADTLRADALGAWGRQPSLTPALDALAAESDVWLDAFTVANATNPSFASILTGLYVHHHGVADLDTPLPEAQVTLAERLREAGYDTAAILAAQHVGPHRSGLGQGFDRVHTPENTSAARLAVSQAMAELERPRAQPFFLWLHLFDPHTPHSAPAPYGLGLRAQTAYGLDRVRAWLPFRAQGPRAFSHPVLAAHRELYDGEVAYLDRELDRLFGWLRQRGLLENTVVAVVADHGENLEDHGVRFRHAGLWDTTTHVPLMIRWPEVRRPGRRLRGLVQTIDLYPTLLAAAGLRPNPQDGRDLRTLTGEGKGGRRAVFAAQADGRRGGSVRTPRFRYFRSLGSKVVRDGEHFYDLTRDPGELVNLAGQGRREEAELRALLERWQKSAVGSGAQRVERDAATEAELRALGYL